MSCPDTFFILKGIYDDHLKKINECSVDSKEYRFNKNVVESLHETLLSFNSQYPECTPLYTLHLK